MVKRHPRAINTYVSVFLLSRPSCSLSVWSSFFPLGSPRRLTAGAPAPCPLSVRGQLPLRGASSVLTDSPGATQTEPIFPCLGPDTFRQRSFCGNQSGRYYFGGMRGDWKAAWRTFWKDGSVLDLDCDVLPWIYVSVTGRQAAGLRFCLPR